MYVQPISPLHIILAQPLNTIRKAFYEALGFVASHEGMVMHF